MSEALDRISKLRDATTMNAALDALWDLRDSAYDRPDEWPELSAESLFQALAEAVNAADERAADWNGFASLLGAALTSAMKWTQASES